MMLLRWFERGCVHVALAQLLGLLVLLSLAGCAKGAGVNPLDRGGLENPIAGFSALGGGFGSAPSAGMAGVAAGVTAPAAGVAAPVAGSGGTGVPVAGTYAGTTVEAGTFAAAGSSGDPPSAGTTATAGSSASSPPFDAGSDPNRNLVQPGQLCARIAVIQCAGEMHCCISPNRTVDACRAQYMMLCAEQLYLDQIAMNPSTGFDATSTAAAFTQLEQMASQCDVNIVSWAGSDMGLRSILQGTLAPGSSCKPNNLTDPPTAGAALASCTSGATTACLPMSILGDWTCAPRNGAGGSCVTDINCIAGTYCDNPTQAPLGKCAQLLGLGATCTDGSQCSSLFCSAGQCVPASQQLAYCPS